MTESPIKPRTWQLLTLLADGQFHSGEALAKKTGVSRATVYNALVDVAQWGVCLQRIHARGYRLSQPWQPLDSASIQQWLADQAKRFQIEVVQQTFSTNSLLLQRAALGAASGSVIAAELQTAGRGRLGRKWHSGLGNALTFSLLWRFDCGLNALSGLSLAMGVAIMRAINQFGVTGLSLKWPNDILTAQGKLGGILVEAQGDVLGPCAVVIGVGLNCGLPLDLEQRIDQPASALDQVCIVMPTRNQLLAAVLRAQAEVLDEFAHTGFAKLRTEWEGYHAQQNLPIQLNMPNGGIISGIGRGASVHGELLLETAQGVRSFHSGEVGAA